MDIVFVTDVEHGFGFHRRADRNEAEIFARQNIVELNDIRTFSCLGAEGNVGELRVGVHALSRIAVRACERSGTDNVKIRIGDGQTEVRKESELLGAVDISRAPGAEGQRDLFNHHKGLGIDDRQEAVLHRKYSRKIYLIQLYMYQLWWQY